MFINTSILTSQSLPLVLSFLPSSQKDVLSTTKKTIHPLLNFKPLVKNVLPLKYIYHELKPPKKAERGVKFKRKSLAPVSSKFKQ